MVLEKKEKKENKSMKKIKKFQTYLNKTVLGKILKFGYKTQILKGQVLSVNYFYWWYKELYNFKTIGICARKKKKLDFSPLSFTLFFIIKKVRVNQVYISTSPFITLIKKKKDRKKLIKTIYVL